MEEKVTENNEVNKSNKIKIIVLTLLVFFIAISGITYAYFSIQIRGNEEASSMSLVTANLSLIYTDLQVRSGENVIPGWSTTKTVTVENNGTDTVDYVVKWRELQNTIINNELVISATCTSNIQGNTCPNISESPVPSASSQTTNVYIHGPVSIEPNEIHTYTATVTFKESGIAQDYNEGK